MSIATAITNAQNKVANAYTSVSNKGGTLPATQNLSNLPTAINSIPSGGDTPTLISKTITQNGIYNASSDNADGYSSVTVNVSDSSIGIPREVKNGVYQMPTESFTFSLPSDVTDVGDFGLNYAFRDCTGLTSVDLSSLTAVSGSNALSSTFRGCTSLTSVNLSSLTTVGPQALNAAFYGCTSLTSVDLSSLATVIQTNGCNGIFNGCTSLTSVDFASLETVTGSGALGSAFSGCTGIQNIYFKALKTTSFGNRVNQLSNMMSNTGSTTTHTIHFPSNMQSTISGLSGYPLFGGTSGYVVLAFDLPATS